MPGSGVETEPPEPPTGGNTSPLTVKPVPGLPSVLATVQSGMAMVFVFSVTAPESAMALPHWIVALFPIATVPVSAIIVPRNVVVVPIMSPAPVTQVMLPVNAPGPPALTTSTVEPLAVVSELPIWKIYDALLLPPALSWSNPFKEVAELKL